MRVIELLGRRGVFSRALVLPSPAHGEDHSRARATRVSSARVCARARACVCVACTCVSECIEVASERWCVDRAIGSDERRQERG